MFNIGDAVIYANTGLCIIEDIKEENFLGTAELYYTLNPVHSKGSTVFCPVENMRVVMRSVTPKDELIHALSPDTKPTDKWIENDHERRSYFNTVLKNCVFSETLSVVRVLNNMKNAKMLSGKKLHATDEKALAECEKILFGEISHVLGISYDEAAEMIRSNI